MYYKTCLNENMKDINKLPGKNIDHLLPKHGNDKEIAENMSTFFTEKIKNIREELAVNTINFNNESVSTEVPILRMFPNTR